MSLLPGGDQFVDLSVSQKIVEAFADSAKSDPSLHDVAASLATTSLEAKIENQVEIDALRLEARQIWEARRAALTPEERELEDLEIDLEDLNRGIHAREAEGG